MVAVVALTNFCEKQMIQNIMLRCWVKLVILGTGRGGGLF